MSARRRGISRSIRSRLPPTKENLQFLFSFFRVLIEGNDQRYRIDFKEER